LYSSEYSSTTSDHYAVSARFTLFDMNENGKNNPNMVQLCHNGKPIFVSENAVDAHLAKGAVKGSCSENEVAVFAAPNPVVSETTINIENFKTGQAYMTVYGLSGNVVFTDKLQVKKGSAAYNFNMSGFKPGIYIVEVKNSFGQITYTKVVKK
ncbi:MAG TPA: T9SS type A sorting domain-containing protein, partial [Christiangramia sp.]|nr:T9SS type A sorting domain-containing protein [Christiangramia sp.]